MTTQRQTDGNIQDLIPGMVDKEWTPSQIHGWLEKNAADVGHIPHLRTIQRIVRDLKLRDGSGVWRLSDDDGADTENILNVLGFVIEWTEGRKSTFTKNEASWVRRVLVAAPDLHQHAVYLLAREYLRREEQNAEVVDLDGFLAFAPWRDEKADSRYREAVAAKYVPQGPLGTFYLVSNLGISAEFHTQYFSFTFDEMAKTGWKRE